MSKKDSYFVIYDKETRYNYKGFLFSDRKPQIITDKTVVEYLEKVKGFKVFKSEDSLQEFIGGDKVVKVVAPKASPKVSTPKVKESKPESAINVEK